MRTATHPPDPKAGSISPAVHQSTSTAVFLSVQAPPVPTSAHGSTERRGQAVPRSLCILPPVRSAQVRCSRPRAHALPPAQPSPRQPRPKGETRPHRRVTVTRGEQGVKGHTILVPTQRYDEKMSHIEVVVRKNDHRGAARLPRACPAYLSPVAAYVGSQRGASRASNKRPNEQTNNRWVNEAWCGPLGETAWRQWPAHIPCCRHNAKSRGSHPMQARWSPATQPGSSNVPPECEAAARAVPRPWTRHQSCTSWTY